MLVADQATISPWQYGSALESQVAPSIVTLAHADSENSVHGLYSAKKVAPAQLSSKFDAPLSAMVEGMR